LWLQPYSPLFLLTQAPNTPRCVAVSTFGACTWEYHQPGFWCPLLLNGIFRGSARVCGSLDGVFTAYLCTAATERSAWLPAASLLACASEQHVSRSVVPACRPGTDEAADSMEVELVSAPPAAPATGTSSLLRRQPISQRSSARCLLHCRLC